MKHVSNLLLIEASALAGMGFFTGAVAGILALLTGSGVAGKAEVVGTVYWILAVALPVALWLPHYAMDPRENADAYRSPGATFTTVLLGALIGSALGAYPFFLVTGINVPVVLGGQDATAFSDAVRAQVLWVRFGLVVMITVVLSLPIALWAYATRSREVSHGGSV